MDRLESPTVFQELYDEIQQLGKQQSLAIALASKQPSALLRHKDIDELIAYSKKFIKDTRIELTSYSEQAVQCAFDVPVVTTPPPYWPSDEDISIAGSLNPASAVKIVKKLSPPSVLNNERGTVTPQHVRNIGTNVNFSTATKCTNVSVQSETIAKETKETQTAPPVVRGPIVPKARIWRLCTQKAKEEVASRKLAAKPKEKPRSGKQQPVVAEPKCREDEEEEPTVVEQDEERTSANELERSEQPAITKCLMPSTSIEGSKCATLKVQTTSKINIVHVKNNGKSSMPSHNIGYMEFRHESLEIGHQVEAQEPVSDAPDKVEDADVPETVAPPEDNLEETIIHIPKTVQKLVNSAKLSKKPNRYLQPFMSLGNDAPSSPIPTITVELFDEGSSATSDEDTVDPVVTDLLSLHRKKTPTSADKTPDHDLTPKTSRSKQSLQDVSSVPTLKSPPAPEEILMHDDTSSKFIEKLRIWRSALEMQSQNMKLGNQLTENLDTLKQNMKIISAESKHIAQISENFESNLKRMERLTVTEQRQPSVHSANAGCECFGCRTTYEVPSQSPLSIPSHKSFQRVLLEQSPRYARTIRNLCAVGAEQDFRRSPLPTEVVERAARKFLDTCKRTISSGSSPVSSDPCNGRESRHSFSSGSMDLVLSSTSQDQDSSGSLRRTALFSDEGEVLSQGEIR